MAEAAACKVHMARSTLLQTFFQNKDTEMENVIQVTLRSNVTGKDEVLEYIKSYFGKFCFKLPSLLLRSVPALAYVQIRICHAFEKMSASLQEGNSSYSEMMFTLSRCVH